MTFGYSDCIMVTKKGVQSMKKEVSAEILFNRQVNYYIIEKLWELHNKDDDKTKLYKVLGISANVYSRIRKADTYYIVDLEKYWDRKNCKLKALGLSKEIMTGMEMIQIAGIDKADWKEYFTVRYEEDKNSSYRNAVMQNMNRKLRKAFNGLMVEKNCKSDIGKLLYFCVHGRAIDLDIGDIEIRDLIDCLKNVTTEKMKVCDITLRKEAYDLLLEKAKQLEIIISYDNLA